MDLIGKGIEQGLIRFDEERNFITYIHQNIRRNYNNELVEIGKELSKFIGHINETEL